MIRVVLVDDDDMLRSEVKTHIDSEPDLMVVGEASTGADAIALVAETKPDVVLLDVEMPDIEGITGAAIITADSTTAARILMLTTFQRSDYLFSGLRAGAHGFVVKTAPAEELTDAVRIVADGHSLLDPASAGDAIRHFPRVDRHVGSKQIGTT